MLCFHHNDLDGRLAAALVLRNAPDCRLIALDYRDVAPVDRAGADERIMILDFFFEKASDWKKLLEITQDIVWIDHHESAIRKAEELGIDGLKGIRKSGESASRLTWKWFYGDSPVPEALRLIDAWDVWTHNDDPEVVDFIYGLKIENTHPASSLWPGLLSSGDAIQRIRRAGRTIARYEGKKSRSYVNAFAFEVQFEGHRCLACNIGAAGSKLFDSLKHLGYDIFITFVYDGAKYSVTLSSNSVPVNEPAEKYGGGGHKGAAGFICDSLPFSSVGERPST